MRNPQQNISTLNPTVYNKNYIIHQEGIIPGKKDLFSILKSNEISHTYRLKKKNYTILSMDTEKAFDKIPNQTMMKTLS
jgi:tRNA A22 N-methylase